MKSHFRKWTSAVTAVTVAGFVACTTSNGGTGKETDRRIASQVERGLKRDPVYKFRDIQVSTAGGTVQLSGFTPSPKARQRAGEIAKKIEGVTNVVNNIVVQE